MFGMSGTEMIIILIFGLLLFGPQKLPEIAKMLGKGMREFQKATNDIRSTVEHEFNKMADLEPEKKPAPEAPRVVELKPVPGAVVAVSPAPVEPAAAPPAPAPAAGEEKSSS